MSCEPVVVLCPGLGLPGAVWREVAAGLAGYRVLSVDRPGLDGVPTALARPTLAGEADRIARLLDAGSIGTPVHLVGHSMSGFIVEAFARLHPDRVASLVLVDSSVEPMAGNALARFETRVWRAVQPLLPGWLGTIPATVAELAEYPVMATDLDALRDKEPLPDVPVGMLAVCYDPGHLLRGMWFRRQQRLARLLASSPPGRRHDVVLEAVTDGTHNLMISRPGTVIAAIRRTAGPPG